MKFLIVLVLPFIFFACSHMKVVDLEPSARPMENRSYEIVKETVGESSEFYLLWFIPVTDSLNKKRAVDSAINLGEGDNLIEVSYYEQYQILPFGRIKNFYARGKVIRYK